MTKDYSLWSLADAIEWTRDQNNRRRSEHIRDSRRISMMEEKFVELEKLAMALTTVLELHAEKNRDLLACMNKVDPDYKKQG